MEALVPAFVLAVLTQLGDRPAMLSAILADRYGRPVAVALAAAAAHAVGNGAAAIGGAVMAPMLTPNAQALLLAVALFFAAVGSLWPVKPPGRLEAWRLGSLLTAFLGVFALATGDRTQFLTMAVAARGQPGFAVAGATAGAFVVALVAAVLGELAWTRISFRWFRVLTGLAFLLGSVLLGLWVLRLL